MSAQAGIQPENSTSATALRLRVPDRPARAYMISSQKVGLLMEVIFGRVHPARRPCARRLFAGGGAFFFQRRLLGRQHLVDPHAIDIDHFKSPVLPLADIGSLRQLAQ